MDEHQRRLPFVSQRHKALASLEGNDKEFVISEQQGRGEGGGVKKGITWSENEIRQILTAEFWSQDERYTSRRLKDDVAVD